MSWHKSHEMIKDLLCNAMELNVHETCTVQFMFVVFHHNIMMHLGGKVLYSNTC